MYNLSNYQLIIFHYYRNNNIDYYLSFSDFIIYHSLIQSLSEFEMEVREKTCTHSLILSLSTPNLISKLSTIVSFSNRVRVQASCKGSQTNNAIIRLPVVFSIQLAVTPRYFFLFEDQQCHSALVAKFLTSASVLEAKK